MKKACIPPAARSALALRPRAPPAPRPLLLPLLRGGAAAAAAAPRGIHTSTSAPASVAPIYGTGPPPEPPVPSAEDPYGRIARRRRQAELLREAQGLRSGGGGKQAAGGGKDKDKPLKRRFWQHVDVKEVDGAYEVHLDTRPLRHPTTKAIVRLPLSKPHLAHALALEWDLLTSVQQATRHHLIPLTSLVCRALDIADDDARHAAGGGAGPAPIRAAVAATLLRYLDTDALLCWAPPPDALRDRRDDEGLSLRDRQERAAAEVVRFLRGAVWPGVDIGPVLDGSGLVPRPQKPGVREVVQGWVAGLEPWDLAGLERATLAGKTLLGAARLVAEWSEGSAARRPGAAAAAAAAAAADEAPARFGVEEAARVASIEVDWQIGVWGEVEDTHDVEKEDLRRQLGSAVLLVSGTGTAR